jgi:hypothetical protein
MVLIGQRAEIAVDPGYQIVDHKLPIDFVISLNRPAAGPTAAPAPKPKLVFKDNVGGAISSPIMVDDYVIAAAYDATVHVYKIDYQAQGGVPLKDRSGREWTVGVKEVATFTGAGAYESTPIVWQGRIYIGSRNGSLYCLGDPAYRPADMPEVP